MPTLQQMFEVAMRHRTAMADAMVIACIKSAHERGVTLRAPGSGAKPSGRADG